MRSQEPGARSRKMGRVVVCLVVAGVGSAALGEEVVVRPAVNSLAHQALARRAADAVVVEPEKVAPVSFTAVPAASPRRFRKHDLVTIIVRQDSEMTTTANVENARKQDYNFSIDQFLEFARFAGTFGLGNVANPGKLPEIKFKLDNNRTADATNERKDHMSLRITAEVVDVKPNGTMVIEAVARIRHDKEEQVMRLSGVTRAEDVLVDNTVLSTQLANLHLVKETRGEVREGTKRSWISGFLERIGP